MKCFINYSGLKPLRGYDRIKGCRSGDQSFIDPENSFIHPLLLSVMLITKQTLFFHLVTVINETQQPFNIVSHSQRWYCLLKWGAESIDKISSNRLTVVICVSINVWIMHIVFLFSVAQWSAFAGGSHQNSIKNTARRVAGSGWLMDSIMDYDLGLKPSQLDYIDERNHKSSSMFFFHKRT